MNYLRCQTELVVKTNRVETGTLHLALAGKLGCRQAQIQEFVSLM